MSLLPIFMKVEGRRCLVVGAGEVASGKIVSLVDCGAEVTVIAPWAKPEILALAEQGRIHWMQREFFDTDIDGQFVVIAGTDKIEVNQRAYRHCVAANILCNAVDDPPHCDFYYGSVVSRGDLQIAISTTGQSPSFAQRLRREIDALLTPGIGPWLTDLGALRREVLSVYPAGEERKHLLQQLGERSVCEATECPSRHLALTNAPGNTLPTVGTVYLVGAGPGDPDLLTVKAARLLRHADLVLHDDLVPHAIVSMASAAARVVGVGKRCGRASITQEEIHRLMIEGARAGRSVVRLKSGDPLLFGRAGEELDALRDAQIPVEIVSGVTAASAAAAAIPCSLTDRRSASGILLSTAHTAPDEPAHAEPTRIVYMPGRDLSKIARAWQDEGLAESYTCVLVSRAGQPDQQTTFTTLRELAFAQPGPAPTLLMGGAVFARAAQARAASIAHSEVAASSA
jgi:uroporphyrin-III C-methyltransferase/precorrin-2 dehydrogenase/sirohydrochlorin ferrochelatase